MKKDELTEIMEAAEGLLYPSESDEPLEPVQWGCNLEDEIARTARGREVVEQDADTFFAALEGAEDEEGWRELQLVMDRNLREVKVFRIGERRVEILVVGQNRTAEWVGFKTVSVET